MIRVNIPYIDKDFDEILVTTCTPKANSVVCTGIDGVKGSGIVIPFTNAYNIQWTPVEEEEE